MAADFDTPDLSFVQEFGLRYLEAWNAHDVQAVLDLVVPEITWDDPAMREPALGVDAVREFAELTFTAFPDIEFSAQPSLGEAAGPVTPTTFVAPWLARGTMRGAIDPPGFAPTGRRFSVEGIDLWRFRDRRLASVRTFYDLLGWCKQLGLIPDPYGRAGQALVVLQRLGATLLGRRG